MSELLEIAKEWKKEMDRLNAETEKRLEEFLKMSEKSKVWRHKNE